MRKLKYSLAVLALVVLAACNKAEMPGYLSDPDAVRIEAAVGVLTKSNPLGTPEEQRTFNEGDRIAVTNAGKTVVYKLNGNTWAPENSNEYLKWDKSALYFQVEYPADYKTLPKDQSTIEKLALADDMFVHESRSTIPEDRTLSVKLGRQNALVKIKIAGYLDQYDKDVHKINFVTIGQGSTWGGNDRTYMVEKPLVQDAGGKIIEDETFSAGTVGYTYSGIVCPNETRNDGLRFIHLQVSESNNQNVELLDVNGVPELKAGHAYTFELYVGKNTVKIGNVTVKDWTTGGDLPDGETDAIDTWDGQTTEAFATKDAEGHVLGYDADNPILIGSCAQLAYLSKQVDKSNNCSGMYFKLTDDLNLAGKPWSPIGYKSTSGISDTPFCGTFDGAGHEIIGLKVNANQNYLGLFGYIKGATVKNLKVSSADISTENGDYGAILCALAEEGSTISSCSVSGKVRIENMHAGGLVAEFKNSTMTECTADVEVNSQQYVGGLCGMLKYGKISKCTVLPGSTIAVITNAYIPSVGGLIGNIDSDGNASSQIRNCNTYATVSGFGNVGGAIGYVVTYRSHQIDECTVYGDVSVSLPSGKQNFGIGGFVGTVMYNSVTPQFSNCGFNGSVSNTDGTSFPAGSIYGTFVGFDESNAKFDDCWYNADKAGELSSVGTGVKDKDYTGINAKNLGK